LTCFPGWTYEYIDQHIDIPRLISLNSYWQKHPPLHLLAAAFMGVKGAGAEVPDQDGGSLHEAAAYIPNNALTPDQFAAKLAALGLPVE